jgi:cullin-associated NEDD8-dissociated protein 1
VDVLIEVLRSFGDSISPPDLEKLQSAVLGLIENDRCSSVVKKRAVNALAFLCVYASDGLLSNTISHLILAFRATSIDRRLNIPSLTRIKVWSA